ncbi:MAG: glycosyltransferase [Elusimicrobiota bacterium]|nr:glycosyltransferase [Elusimicrobiota bacterium]
MNMRTTMNAARLIPALLAVSALGGAPRGAAGAEILVEAPMAAENKRTAFRKSMRKLWAEHAIWTRAYIVAAAAGTPDTAAAASRLLRNQREIGAAFVPYYGDETGAKLGRLVKEHVLIGADLLAALKKGDENKRRTADRLWQENAVELAALLDAANPHWPKQAYEEMFRHHLALTARQMTARLGKKWEEDIAAFDEAYSEILTMADDLADGMIKQFPEKI